MRNLVTALLIASVCLVSVTVATVQGEQSPSAKEVSDDVMDDDIDSGHGNRVKRAVLPWWVRSRLGWVIATYGAVQTGRAAWKMLDAYYDMRRANYRHCDKYFHCRGNYDAARCCGIVGRIVSSIISDAREWSQARSGRGHYDSAEDTQANNYGRAGGNCQWRYITATHSTSTPCRLPRRLWY